MHVNNSKNVFIILLFKSVLKYILKVAFHLLLQNIGYILNVIQHLLKPTLHPTACASQQLVPTLTLPTGNHLFIVYIYESASFLLYSQVCCSFRFHI